MIVYVVTTNVSSERKIKGVFEDREQAICCCALLNHDDAELEEWDTEGIKISGNKKPLHEWTIYVNDVGEVIDLERKYTYEKAFRRCKDFDGSCTIHMTLDMSVSEEEAKQIARDNWQKMQK